MTDFSHALELNIGNIFDELTPAKSKDLILTEIEYTALKITISQWSLKQHL